MSLLDTPVTRQLGIEVPLICGAMYPCSNPELVAAVSEAGGIGVLQPLSLVYVHGHEFGAGLKLIRSLTSKPVGMNVIVERSSKVYEERMQRFVDQAIEGGIRFFVTSLGNPRWVVEKAHAAGGFVYHDVTERKWAMKGLEAGVDGLIAVNNRAGGHAGPQSAEALIERAGGSGRAARLRRRHRRRGRTSSSALKMGYAAVQMGTRFIATTECTAPADYKQAIVEADEDDIVLTERITGVPVSVIRTPYIEKMGTKAGPFARWMLKGRKTKHWMRTIYALQSLWKLKRSSRTFSYRDYLQAGKSVAGVEKVEPAGEIVRRFRAAAQGADQELPAKKIGMS